MKLFNTYLFSLCAVVLLIGCGKGKKETNSIPAPPPITSPDPGTLPDFGPIGGDNRFPALLDKSVVFDSFEVSGLEDIALAPSDGVFELPLVGDPRYAFELSGSGSATTGRLLVSFEDQQGAYVAVVPTFKEYVVQSGSTVDIIFQDSELIFRVIGTKSGDTFTGSIWYRAVHSTISIFGQPYRPCTSTKFYCELVLVTPGSPYYNPSYVNSCSVDSGLQDSIGTYCSSYMDTNKSQVKKLGTFSTSWSKWF